MSETIQVAEEQSLGPAPRLLIEWSPRWQEFCTSIGPALSRSPRRLAGEAPHRLFPYRKIILVWLGEAIFLALVIWLPYEIERLRPHIAAQPPAHDVIYYSGDELPQTEDLGGSQTGASGRAGGQEAHHRTQTIRIARGSSLVAKVVDAPNLRIPMSKESVANLIAVRPNAGPPPSEGLKSARSTPSATAVIAPPPQLLRELTRGAPSMEAVVAPAPSVNSDTTHRTLTLDPSLIAPAPTLAHQHGRSAPSLNTNVIAPVDAELSSRNQRTAPTVSANIVPPSPSLSGNETPRTSVEAVDPAVVPPPVSAPVRDSARTAKLTLPAPAVIAPPPSTDAADLRHMPSGGPPDPSKAVVQPPPSAPNSGSFVSTIIGKIFGDSQVVPPPPSVSGDAGGVANGRSPNGGNTVAAGSNVVAPPPAVSGGSGTGSRSAASLASSGSSGVVQPPPSVSGSGTGRSGPGSSAAGNVVAPPPTLANAAGGSGQGNRGAHLGSSLDSGSVSAPAKSGGNGREAGVVVTNQPGSKVGLPSGASGNLALSPAGGDTPGLGGTGGGKGVVPGAGPGSGLAAEGPGAGKPGPGHGADPNARGGISPTAGPGGAGNATAGTPAVPGVSVSGGTTIVNLPSFGDSGSPAAAPGRSGVKSSGGGFDVSVIGTSRSGGAFNYYGLLPADSTTVFFQTPLGQAAFQYAEAAGAARNAPALASPQLLHADPLTGVSPPRLTLACTLDVYGNLKNLKILDSDHAPAVPKVMAALTRWKFRPAMRGDQAVEVVAILGFGTDTNDRY